MSNLSVWEKRWQALEGIMDDMIGRYGAMSNPTYKALVGCLKAFGASQFHFFNSGFKQGKLVPSIEYPVEYVLRTTLDQVAHDLSVIEWAANQRVNGFAMLDKTDKLAQDALNLAVEAGLLNKSTVITYFKKSAEVRVIPYAPVALIGVPFTAIEAEQDMLAIPHEVGHYVYRHTLGLAAEVDAMMPLQPPWLRRWAEEIFADVYGCLVAGPVIGLDFQDLCLDNSLEDFVSDDSDHPVEAIRPDLYTKVLAELGFTTAAEALNQRWVNLLEKRGNPTYFIPYGEFIEEFMADARVTLEEAAGKVLKRLEAVRQVRQADPDRYWSQGPTNGAAVESLYQAFTDKVGSLPTISVPQLHDLGDKVGFVEEGVEATNERSKGATNLWFDGIKMQDSGSEGYELPAAVWGAVLSAGGWNSKGPENAGGTGLP
jgi:hypothetical protein